LIRYTKYNGVAVSNGKTGREVAEKLLAENGLGNVAVAPCGFWRWLIFGNSYSRRKQTVFLRKNVIDVASLVATATAARIASLAILDKEGDKSVARRVHYQVWSLIAPWSFIPIIIIGIIVDILVFADLNLGLATIIAVVFALLILLWGIFGEHFVLKSERSSCDRAIDLLLKGGLINQSEVAIVRTFFDTYITRQILKFILAILEFIKVLLQLVLTILKSKK